MKILLTLLIWLLGGPAHAFPFVSKSDTRAQIAAILHRYVALDEASLTWAPAGRWLQVRGLSEGQPLSARLNVEVQRVAEVQVGARTVYQWAGITVVGHRSTLLFAPENTVAAAKKAIELGVDQMEMDTRETKDHEIIVLHDATVDRTTNGHGPVSEMTLAEIKKLDAGSKFGPEFAGETIPTLAEMLRALKGHALPAIDFKTGDLRRLRQVLQAEGFADAPITFHGSNEDYHAVRAVGGLLIRPNSTWGARSLHDTINEFSPKIINVPEIQFRKSYLAKIHEQNLQSYTNVILFRPFEERRLKRVVDGLPDYLQTDRPDILIPYLRAEGLHP